MLDHISGPLNSLTLYSLDIPLSVPGPRAGLCQSTHILGVQCPSDDLPFSPQPGPTSCLRAQDASPVGSMLSRLCSQLGPWPGVKKKIIHSIC